MTAEIDKTRSEISQLRKLIGGIASGDETCALTFKVWGGAGVCVVPLEFRPGSQSEGFHPDPRFVRTRFPSEVSWAISGCYWAFANNDLSDHASKFEIVGRLGNAAVRVGCENEDVPLPAILNAIFREADRILEEMERDEFKVMPISIEREIADDES